MTSEKAFKELGETPERLEAAVQSLRLELKENGHHNIDYELDTEFLTRFVRASKFKHEKAVEMVTKYYKLRKILPGRLMPKGKGPVTMKVFNDLKMLTVLKQKNFLDDNSTVLRE